MATKRSLDTGQKGRRDVKCSICAENKKVTNAEYYCHNCQKNMCPSCSGKHNDLYENHEVVEELVDNNDLITEKCEKHTDELITFYCRLHDKLLCSKCRFEDHRHCKDPKIIKEFADEYNADAQLQCAPAQLNMIKLTSNLHIKELAEKESSIRKTNIQKDMEDFAMEQKMLISLTKEHRKVCVKIENEIQRCLDKINKSTERKANMFVLKKKLLSKTQRLGELDKKSITMIKQCKFNVMANQMILDNLTYLRTRSIKMVRKINVRIPEVDEDCDIIGCCHLQDRCVVVADKSNCRLKLVDPSSNKIINYCSTIGSATDVCCISPQEFAVAFGTAQVHMYNAENLTQTRIVKLDHRTTRIACHGCLLYCAAGQGNIVYVHDVRDGKNVRKIRLRAGGTDLFSNIRGIAVNGAGDRLYLADCYSGLICVNTDGEQIFHFPETSLELTFARDVTIDHHGRVFVCGYTSNNVVKVAGYGYILGQILSEEDGIKLPYCLCFDVSKSQLYVGGGSNQLLMIEVR